jgi:hypothetical protein
LIATPTFDWLGWSLGIDGAALLAYLAAFYKYGDRTDIYKNSLSGTSALLVEIERQIAFELAVRLQPLFRGDPPPVIELSLIQPDGTPFKEVAVNPVGSENYRQAVVEFVLAENEAMNAYRIVTTGKGRWGTWARRLSWSLLTGIGLHGVLGFGLLGVRFAEWNAPVQVLIASCGLSFCLFVFVLLCAALMMRSHDQIQQYKGIYGSD